MLETVCGGRDEVDGGGPSHGAVGYHLHGSEPVVAEAPHRDARGGDGEQPTVPLVQAILGKGRGVVDGRAAVTAAMPGVFLPDGWGCPAMYLAMARRTACGLGNSLSMLLLVTADWVRFRTVVSSAAVGSNPVGWSMSCSNRRLALTRELATAASCHWNRGQSPSSWM